MAIVDGSLIVEVSNFQNQPALAPPEIQQAMTAAVTGDVIRANGDLVTYGASIAINDNFRIVLFPTLESSDLLGRRVRIAAAANPGQRGEGVVVGIYGLELPSDDSVDVAMVTFLTDAGMYINAAAADVELVEG